MVNLNDMAAMSSQKATIGGGGMLIKDYEILLSFLEKNYEVKQEWRKSMGIVSDDGVHFSWN